MHKGITLCVEDFIYIKMNNKMKNTSDQISFILTTTIPPKELWLVPHLSSQNYHFIIYMLQQLQNIFTNKGKAICVYHLRHALGQHQLTPYTGTTAEHETAIK